MCAFRPPAPQAAPVRLLSKAPSFPKEGTAARLRWLLREYGALGACTHFSIYFATLGGLFLGVDNEVRRASRGSARPRAPRRAARRLGSPALGEALP